MRDWKKIIDLQLVLGRTHVGRVLNSASKDMLNYSYDEERGYCECNNCCFVAYKKAFINGCPNCNSREKQLNHRGIHAKENIWQLRK